MRWFVAGGMSEREDRVEACALAPAAPIRDALRILETCEGKIALVVKPGRRLLGTITDGDVRRAMLQGVALDAPVTEIMNAKPATASVGTPPSALREAMTQGGFRQMPLLDQDGTVRGKPFFRNNYEAPGGRLRYTERDIRARLERVLRS